MKQKNLLHLTIQHHGKVPKNFPPNSLLKKWLNAAFIHAAPKKIAAQKNIICNVRFVNEKESAQLNHTYRGKNYATNILSFPYQNIKELADTEHYLGDLVICLPVLEKEAREQEKTLQQHLAHLSVHGMLHLLGYTHGKPNSSKKMEKREIKVLAQLNFPDPYR